MYIKRYEAPTLVQAVEKVRNELGADAVILSTRSIRPSGLFPWFKRPVFEVIAARDADSEEGAAAQKPLRNQRVQTPPLMTQRPSLNVVVNDRSDNKPIKEEPVQPAQPVASQASQRLPELQTLTEVPADSNKVLQPEAPPVQSYPKLDAVLSEIEKLKEQIAQAQAGTQPAPARVITEIPQGSSGYPPVRESSRFEGISKLEEILTASSLGQGNIDRIVNRCINDAPGSELRDPQKTFDRGRESLKAILEETRDWGDIGDGGSKRMVFVGPTGVGKTTTIAKLAARYSLMQNKSVALIAADTYRIAAISQLRMYGELMGIEVDVVHSLQEMASIVEKRRERDVVLIDTAGRSPRNKQGMDALRALLEAAEPTETHLVMSITTKASDLKEILDRFSPLCYDRLLFTKIDESEKFGEMVDTILSTGYPVSFLSTGQSVPNDIEAASAERVSRLLLPDMALRGE